MLEAAAVPPAGLAALTFGGLAPRSALTKRLGAPAQPGPSGSEQINPHLRGVNKSRVAAGDGSSLSQQTREAQKRRALKIIAAQEISTKQAARN